MPWLLMPQVSLTLGRAEETGHGLLMVNHQVAQPGFDSAGALIWFVEGNVFLSRSGIHSGSELGILRSLPLVIQLIEPSLLLGVIHSFGIFLCKLLRLTALLPFQAPQVSFFAKNLFEFPEFWAGEVFLFFLKLQPYNVVETVSKVLLDRLWIASVGKDVEQGSVGHEVEAREEHTLDFEILEELFLALLKAILHLIEDFESLLIVQGISDKRSLDHFLHELAEFSVNFLKSSSILRQLLTNILRANEDSLERTPVSLDLNPIVEYSLDGTQTIGPEIDILAEELDVLSLSLHGL
mmetsp:Transcript_1750/g.3340  ORF Transcript_1750/g.3340 Transcript_1750/m.3340 type:complete len:295 (-) Transcript_1750:4509-5393(-)